jgi:hypothetical protein
VPGLPSASYDSKSPRSRIAHILVWAFNVRSHCGNHLGQTSRFGQVTNNFSTFNSGIVIFVDQEGFNDGEDSMDVRTHKVVELIQNPVDDFDQ